jgi:hypothetical protein
MPLARPDSGDVYYTVLRRCGIVPGDVTIAIDVNFTGPVAREAQEAEEADASEETMVHLYESL